MDKSKIDRLTSKKKSEVKRLIYMFDDTKSIPTFLDLPDYIEFLERVDRTMVFIGNSDNPRMIILETWLIIDYSIRQILRYGLEVDKFSDDNFDILPQGFKDCSKLLQNFIKIQKEKLPNPAQHIILLPYEFKIAMLEDKEFLKKYCQYEQEYYSLHKVTGDGYLTNKSDNRFRNVADEWLHVIRNLDDDWFDKANKLNSVRNFAAHSFDKNMIFKKLGLTGRNTIDKLKDYCILTMKDLIGLK